MRNLKRLLIGGAAAAALVFGVSAIAKTSPQTHEMNVALPDGAVVHVEYRGEKPIVTLSRGAALTSWLNVWQDPLWPAVDANSLQAPDISQITANIDRQMQAMRAHMARLDHLAINPSLASDVSSSGAAGSFCAHSVEVTQAGNAAPHIEERSYGNCAAARAPAVHAAAHTGTRT